MHERQTPTNLLDGRPWACWGPPVEAGRSTDRVLALLARRTGRPLDEVAERLLSSAARGRYLLLAQLSLTEHAAVYAGIDRLLARDVAVKIHRDKRTHATQRALFESQALARLDHPNIVRILDMGEHASEHAAWMYSVIELCDADLSDWHVGRPWQQIVARVIEAGRGLAKLHELGYAHCDVKPKNILIHDGVAKLADFGSVHAIGPCTSWLGGTVGFVAPEVFERGPSAASDVFALAATLWVSLFGRLPYPLPDGAEVTRRTAFALTLQRAAAGALARPDPASVELPAALLRALEYSLDPDPVVRPSLEGLLGRLGAVLDREARRSRRRRWGPVLVGGLAVAIGGGFWAGARLGGSGEDGDGVFWAAAGVVNPLARAEAAAYRGDLNGAIGGLYRLDASIERLSVEESLIAAKAAERIAKVLEDRRQDEDARSAWYFAARLYKRAGQTKDVDRIKTRRR